MVTGTITVGAGLVLGQATENEQVAAQILERGKCLGKLAERTRLLRGPARHVRPVGHIEKGHSPRILCTGCVGLDDKIRGQHCIQERKRHRGANAS